MKTGVCLISCWMLAQSPFQLRQQTVNTMNAKHYRWKLEAGKNYQLLIVLIIIIEFRGKKLNKEIVLTKK